MFRYFLKGETCFSLKYSIGCRLGTIELFETFKMAAKMEHLHKILYIYKTIGMLKVGVYENSRVWQIYVV